MVNNQNPAVTAPQNFKADENTLSKTALDGLDQAIRKNREVQDYKTQVNAAQKYSHQQTVQRAQAWTQ